MDDVDQRTSAERGTSPAAALAFGTIALGIFGVVALLVAFVIGAGKSDGGTSNLVANAGPKTVDVALAEFAVTPASIDVAAGTDLTVHVTNKGTMAHDLALAGATPKVPLLNPGQSADLHVGVVSASAQLWCTVPGHKAAGMVLTVNVSGAGTEVATATHDMAAGSSSGDATIDANAKPGPDWKPFDPHLRRPRAAPSTR